MATFTEHYQLHQWEADDNFLREDFNTDFAKIDTAMAAMPKMKTGHYTGTGVAGITIDVGFRPKFVILLGNDSGARYVMFLLDNALHLITGNSVGCNTSNGNVCYLTETGFCLTGSNYNTQGGQNSYIAFG